MFPMSPAALTETPRVFMSILSFLCLNAGVYLLLMLHTRCRRSGLLLLSIGLAVLALRSIPAELYISPGPLAFVADTVAYLISAVLIVAGTLALVDDTHPRAQHTPGQRIILIAAASIAAAAVTFVWLLPFWPPFQRIIASASAQGAFTTFQQGLRVAVAAAWFACAWIMWERRMLGRAPSRMFGAALFCWGAALVLDSTHLAGALRVLWIPDLVMVLGCLFVANALTSHVHEAEKSAAERRRRLALIDRVASAALSAPNLATMIEAASDEVRALLEASYVAIYLKADDGPILRRMYGSGSDILLPAEVVTDDDHPLAQALSTGQPVCLSRDGRQHPDDRNSRCLRGVAVPLHAVSDPIGTLAVIMSASGRMNQAEVHTLVNVASQLGVMIQHMILLERVRSARDRWTQTFNAITDIVTVHDADGTITVVNAAAMDAAGVSDTAEIIGRTVSEVFGPDEDEPARSVAHCLATGEAMRATVTARGGRVHDIRIMPMRDASGEVCGCVRVARDMTSQWRTEERLAQSERRYRDLTENANDIIYTHDPEGNILYMNRAGVDILGYSQREFAQLRFWDIVSKESVAKAREYVHSLLQGRSSSEQIELTVNCADGKVAVLQLRANVLRRSGETAVVQGIARDVTAEKQLREQLLQADRLASVGTLIAGIAHELNNPLTAICGYADMLTDAFEDGRGVYAIRTIAKEASRCRAVAQNLLNFARQTDGELTEFEIPGLVLGVTDLRAYDLRAARIEVHTDFAEDLPPIVADYGAVQQVVYNIVDNAYDALREQEGGHLEIRAWASDGHVSIEIKDDGPGLPEGAGERIFEPFFTTKARDAGTGLGLSICRRIMREHDGDIRARNHEDGGAVFTITLPLRREVASEPELDTPASQRSPQPEQRAARDVTSMHEEQRETGRILFIEDEKALSRLVAEYLEAHGHEVTLASTGEEGLRAALAESFDCIVCDMRLPGITGEEVCTRLLEEKPDIAGRIIVATGDILSPSTQQFFERTGLAHIHKPFSLNDLSAQIALRLGCHVTEQV